MYKSIKFGRPTAMYPPEIIAPMRGELTDLGIQELTTAEEVEAFFADSSEPALVVINSVCGCSAGSARPALKIALAGSKKPARLVSVFAGQDTEATAKMREYITGYPPSSPMFALFVDNKPAFAVERHQIEQRSPEDISADLAGAFERLL